MKLWLKANPGITATTYDDNVVNGGVPALVENPFNDPPLYYAGIMVDEWSDTEITPAPEGVPELGYMVLYGRDPAQVEYEFHTREVDAVRSMTKKRNAFGYIAVRLDRNAMIPV